MNSQSKNWSKKLAKASVMMLGAAMTMGNQKCEQAPTAERSLKKIVELGSIRSSPIMFPGGSSFDFQFVANQQIYGVLLDSKAFTLKYNPVIAVPPQQATGDTNFFNLTKADGQMMKSFSQAAGKDNYNIEYAKTAWCMVNIPQAKISGAVNSFELIGGGGLTIGFTPNGALPTTGLTSAGFNVEFSQLDLSLRATRPLTSKVMAAGNVTSKQTKTRVNFGLNFGAFNIGPSAYYQTPLAQVTKNALIKSVDLLSDELKKEEWHTRVLADHDTHMVIIGGLDVGLEPGDQLLIYNDLHYWQGEPCNSAYIGGGSKVSSAVAKVEIDWVGDEISRARVIEQNDDKPEVGARVVLFKFHAKDYKGDEAGVEGSNSNSNESASGQTGASTKPGRG